TSGGIIAGINSTNTIAAFCETHYYFQPVNATVASLNSSVIATTPTGPREVLTVDHFNSTHFESLINVGYNGTDGVREYPDRKVLSIFARVQHMELSWPYNNLVAYALGTSARSFEEYSDPHLLFQAFERAHKLLFALAINHLAASPQSVSNERTAIISTQVQSIFVVRLFAILVEGFLAIVIMSCLVLLVLYWRRTCNLAGDPASIEDVMRLLPLEENTLKDFIDLDAVDASALRTAIKGKWFTLRQTTQPGEDLSSSLRISLCKADIPLPCDGWTANQRYRNQSNRPRMKAILPIEMSWYYGLPIPSENVIVRQILLSYIPTAFATFLEPFWVLLNRLLCILQPFESLNSSRKSSFSPVKLKYTSLPPQFMVQRAWKARSYLLTFVCIVTILANPLAIVLSSLFDIRNVSMAHDVSYRPLFSPRFNDTRYHLASGVFTQEAVQDHYYVELANLTKHTNLPPWISPNFFFIPVQSAAMAIGASTYELPTKGFGIESRCHELGVSTSNKDMFYNISNDGVWFNISTRHALEGGGNITCVANLSVFAPQSQAMEYANGTALPPPSPDYVSIHAVEINSPTLSPWNMKTATATEIAYCKKSQSYG
ncbi:MAG: hypothetical protein Q9187_008919, partial [Circinaria calcarea]